VTTTPGHGHGSADPPADCPNCPRLCAFRSEYREAEPEWFNAPVPSFGDRSGRLLIVGLAPGLRGANRTGRPFTGDWAGDLLYATVAKFEFSRGRYRSRPDDGLVLEDCRITNAVRCVPPQNRPNAGEVRNCLEYLKREMAGMPELSVILALGTVAHGAVLAALGLRRAAFGFGHGVFHTLPDGRVLAASYHCSRYNTNTGRLTTQMFEEVFGKIRDHLAAQN